MTIYLDASAVIILRGKNSGGQKFSAKNYPRAKIFNKNLSQDKNFLKNVLEWDNFFRLGQKFKNFILGQFFYFCPRSKIFIRWDKNFLKIFILGQFFGRTKILMTEHLLEDSYNIPETQHTDMSPTTFGTQLVDRLRIRSLPKERAEAANLNNTNMNTESDEANRPSTSGVASLSNEA